MPRGIERSEISCSADYYLFVAAVEKNVDYKKMVKQTQYDMLNLISDRAVY
jgi:hypothetical protein